MVAAWFPPSAATTVVVIRIRLGTDADTTRTTGVRGPDCTCNGDRPGGWACVAGRHLTAGEAQESRRLAQHRRWLERREEYRDFVGHPPAPRAAVSRDSRRVRAGGNRRDQHAWRTRALGKRPQPAASG
jgi:hypothetical protein